MRDDPRSAGVKRDTLSTFAFRLSPSIAGRPAAHQMLTDAFRRAQPVDLEHADQIVASLLGTDDGLRRVDLGEPPHIGALADLRELLLEAGLADAHAVNDLGGELRA